MPTGPAPAVASAVPGRAHLPRVIAAASVALALTAPGQTAAVSVFVDPIIADLGVSRSAEFLAHILDLEIGTAWGPFLPIELSNSVRLDFATILPEDVKLQHYAFLVPEEDFDGILERIKQADVDYSADPQGTQPGQINHHHGGRGVYFLDPAGHGLEVITRPYGWDLTEAAEQ